MKPRNDSFTELMWKTGDFPAWLGSTRVTPISSGAIDTYFVSVPIEDCEVFSIPRCQASFSENGEVGFRQAWLGWSLQDAEPLDVAGTLLDDPTLLVNGVVPVWPALQLFGASIQPQVNTGIAWQVVSPSPTGRRIQLVGAWQLNAGSPPCQISATLLRGLPW